MAWLGVAYEFIAPDGARAVVGNSNTAMQDGDWCGFLDPEQNVQGLLDGATVRASQSDLVEEDGQSFGPSFLGGRSGTITGFLNPNLDVITQAVHEAKLKRATRALRGDGILRYTPPNDSAPRQLRVRRAAQPSFTGRRPKAFQISLASPDPYVLASTETVVTITPGSPAGEVGIQNPITNPITTSLNTTGQQFVVNQGDAETWPRFRIDGPITNPQVLNNTTGELAAFNYTLNAGEWLSIYPKIGRILLNDTADRYSAYDFLNSEWWKLQPGSNDVRLLASAFSAPALLTVAFKHAYE
jgi:hypothetical protein